MLLGLNIYGEGQSSDTTHNLRGQLYRVYDGSGHETIPDYDFKGAPLTFLREFVTDYTQSRNISLVAFRAIVLAYYVYIVQRAVYSCY